MFIGDAKQDEFAANMVNFKKNGYYIDIGSSRGTISNNSYFFESLDWKGLCIESDPSYNPTYLERSCIYINSDALSIDYKKVLNENSFPNSIDYLSVDIDELSYDALLKLPFDEFNFKVITIEHDFYLYGDLYQKKQREFLESKGYLLICGNVYVEQPGYYNQNLPFEDWWIYPEYFDSNLVEKIKSYSCNPSEIIKKFQI